MIRQESGREGEPQLGKQSRSAISLGHCKIVAALFTGPNERYHAMQVSRMKEAGRSMYGFWFVAGVSVILVGQAGAIGPPHKPSAADIARAIRELGDDSFTVRERASRLLSAAGRAAEPALMAAKSNRDPEVVSRCETILDQFKWGLYPDTPADIHKLVHDYRLLSDEPSFERNSHDPRIKRAIERLSEKGQPGYRALYKIALADEVEQGAIYDELVWAVHRECQRWVEACGSEAAPGAGALGKELSSQALLRRDRQRPSLDGMAAALDWGPATPEDCKPQSLAFRLIRSKALLAMMGGDLDRQLERSQNEMSTSLPKQRAFEAAILARAAGNSAMAAGLAESSGDPALIKSMLREKRDWQSLWQKSQAAERSGDLTYTPLTNADEPAPEPRIIALGERAALARRVGETRLFENLIAELKQFDTKDPPKEQKITCQVNALLGNEKIVDAIHLLRQAGNVDGAIDLLLLQLRYREALQLAASDSATGRDWKADLAQARVWSAAGEPDKATPIFRRALAEMERQELHEHEQDWIDAVFESGRRDLLLAEAGHLRLDNEHSIRLLLRRLFPDDAEEAWVWWRVLLTDGTGGGPQKTLKRIEDLLQRRATVAEIQSYVAGPQQAMIRAAVPAAELQRAIANAYHAIGRDDLVAGMIRIVDKSKCERDQLIWLGDVAAARREWLSAAGDYDLAWRKWPRNGADHASEERAMAALALYLEGQALTRAGQTGRGNRLMELSHWLPLADEDARVMFIDKLQARHEEEAAYREMELVSKIGVPGSDNTWRAHLAMARACLAKKNYRAAADLREMVFLERMHWTSSQGFDWYLASSSSLHQCLAHVHLQAGRIKECIEEAVRAEAASPADVDLAITLCPELTRCGHAAEADHLYRRMFERYKKVSTEYPGSAELHNALAWLAARCHRDLDEALSHARRAVELAPQHPEFIDTLAEAQFQSGNRSEAIESARHCVRLDPHRNYYKKQLARMEEGNVNADVPPAD
jgi:tetratricopeptide (TPR) repeat protein